LKKRREIITYRAIFVICRPRKPVKLLLRRRGLPVRKPVGNIGINEKRKRRSRRYFLFVFLVIVRSRRTDWHLGRDRLHLGVRLGQRAMENRRHTDGGPVVSTKSVINRGRSRRHAHNSYAAAAAVYALFNIVRGRTRITAYCRRTISSASFRRLRNRSTVSGETYSLRSKKSESNDNTTRHARVRVPYTHTHIYTSIFYSTNGRINNNNTRRPRRNRK